MLESEIRSTLNELKTKVIGLKWIPAHQGIEGNEEADLLANKGSKCTQNHIPWEWLPTKRLIGRSIKEGFEREDVMEWSRRWVHYKFMEGDR